MRCFKILHLTPSGRYRRLAAIELEQLHMFPDNHTQVAFDMRRAFLMGNAFVSGILWYRDYIAVRHRVRGAGRRGAGGSAAVAGGVSGVV